MIKFAFTAWKLSKYEVFPGLYFPVFGLNTGKYEPEKPPYLDTFHAVIYSLVNGCVRPETNQTT